MSFFTLTEICLPCHCLPFYRVPQGITLKLGGSPQLKSWHLETFWSRIEKAFRPLCLWCLSRYLSPYTYPLPIFLSGFISLPSLGVSLPMFVCLFTGQCISTSFSNVYFSLQLIYETKMAYANVLSGHFSCVGCGHFEHGFLIWKGFRRGELIRK